MAPEKTVEKTVITVDQALPVRMNTAELSLAVLCVISVVCAQESDQCPTWFRPTPSGCECGSEVGGLIECDQHTNSVAIRLGFSMIYDNSRDEAVFGFNNFAQYSNVTNRFFVPLPSDPLQLNNYTCRQYNRKGLLCGKCVEGYGPAVYYFTFHCTDCSQLSTMSAIALFLLLYLLPITVLFLLIITFRLNVTGGPMLGYVLFCNTHVMIMWSQQSLYYSIRNSLSPFLQVLFDISNTFSEVWSLQLFRFTVKPFCISENLEYIHVILLQYISALYPLVLILITFTCIHLHAHDFQPIVLLWKPFHKYFVKLRRDWSASDSIIHTFASFMLLSFASVIYVSFGLVRSTEVINKNGTSIQTVLVNAPFTNIFSLQHVPYLLTGLVLLFSLGVCPALLLCLYPTRPFKRLTLCCRYRYRIWINIFTDSFQGCYREGPFRTSFYKMIPSAYMFFLIGIISSVIPPRLFPFKNMMLYLSPLFLCQPVLFAYLKPCKSQLMNVSLTFHTALVSMLIILVLQFGVVGTNSHLLAAFFSLLVFLPHAIFIIFILYCVLRQSHLLKTCYNNRVVPLINFLQ